eukprot:Gb_37420 [translate_table: standard]
MAGGSSPRLVSQYLFLQWQLHSNSFLTSSTQLLNFGNFQLHKSLQHNSQHGSDTKCWEQNVFPTQSLSQTQPDRVDKLQQTHLLQTQAHRVDKLQQETLKGKTTVFVKNSGKSVVSSGENRRRTCGLVKNQVMNLRMHVGLFIKEKNNIVWKGPPQKTTQVKCRSLTAYGRWKRVCTLGKCPRKCTQVEESRSPQVPRVRRSRPRSEESCCLQEQRRSTGGEVRMREEAVEDTESRGTSEVESAVEKCARICESHEKIEDNSTAIQICSK